MNNLTIQILEMLFKKKILKTSYVKQPGQQRAARPAWVQELRQQKAEEKRLRRLERNKRVFA